MFFVMVYFEAELFADDALAAFGVRPVRQCGCCVRSMTRSQVRPFGFKVEGDDRVIIEIGRKQVRLLTQALVNPVYPAIVP